jgi:hypothetical protein
MNKGRVGEERKGKETDGYPLTHATKGTDKLVKDHMADSEFSMDAPRMSSQKFKDPTPTSEYGRESSL